MIGDIVFVYGPYDRNYPPIIKCVILCTKDINLHLGIPLPLYKNNNLIFTESTISN